MNELRNVNIRVVEINVFAISHMVDFYHHNYNAFSLQVLN